MGESKRMGSFHKTNYKLCLKVNDERQIADATFLLGEEVMDANGICNSSEPKKIMWYLNFE